MDTRAMSKAKIENHMKESSGSDQKPLIHQAVPLSRPRKKITVTIELCSALTGASRPEHTQGSARLYMLETSMFEHP